MTTDAVGGVWTYALDLARALALRGVRVCLAVMGPPPSTAQRAEAAAVPSISLVEAPYRLEWMDEPWQDLEAAGPWLLQLERETAPDVIHLNTYAHAALPWRAPVVVVGHSCVLSWWSAVHGEEAPPTWSRYAKAITAGLQRADLVVTPTAAMMSALAEHYGEVPRRHVIANGRYPVGLPADIRKEPLILTAGRLWDPAKNVEAVCAVAASLPWPVYVAGACCRPDGYVETLPDSPARWLGRLAPAELGAWMARASIYALPARYEPFGLSALEAGLAGCALVLGDIRSLREVWGQAAVYVPVDNRIALKRAITGLIEDAALRTAMAGRALARARQLTPERMAEAYYAAYTSVLKRPATALAS